MSAQSAKAVKYTDCISAQELDPLPTSVLVYDIKQSDNEVRFLEL